MTLRPSLNPTALLACLLLLAGCQSHRLPQGVHPDAVPVGGGVVFEFVSPEDGIVFVVDASRDELLASASVESGKGLPFGDSPEKMMELVAYRDSNMADIMRIKESKGTEKSNYDALQRIKMPVLTLYFASLNDMNLGDRDGGEKEAGQ